MSSDMAVVVIVDAETGEQKTRPPSAEEVKQRDTDAKAAAKAEQATAARPAPLTDAEIARLRAFLTGR